MDPAGNAVVVILFVGLPLLLIFMLVARAIFDRRCAECRKYINRRARICPYCRTTQ